MLSLVMALSFVGLLVLGLPLAFAAGRMFARGLVRGRLEACVALAALAAMGRDHPFARRRQVLEHVAVNGVDDDRTRRHANDKIFGAAPVAIGAAAVLAALSAPALAMREG